MHWPDAQRPRRFLPTTYPPCGPPGRAYRRGKPRQPVVAAFDLDADLEILAPHRDLAAGNQRRRHAPPDAVLKESNDSVVAAILESKSGSCSRQGAKLDNKYNRVAPVSRSSAG